MGGICTFTDMSSGAYTKFNYVGTLIDSSSAYNQHSVGINTNTSQVNAIQFFYGSGNILTGKFSLYGLVES
jgi:hypothetical protein